MRFLSRAGHSVTALAHTIVDHQVWLDLLEIVAHFVSVPTRPRFLPLAIKPHNPQRTIVVDNFLCLVPQVLEVAWHVVGRFFGTAAGTTQWVVRMVPVADRVVRTELDAVFF